MLVCGPLGTPFNFDIGVGIFPTVSVYCTQTNRLDTVVAINKHSIVLLKVYTHT